MAHTTHNTRKTKAIGVSAHSGATNDGAAQNSSANHTTRELLSPECSLASTFSDEYTTGSAPPATATCMPGCSGVAGPLAGMELA